ncbi:hypothetical protein P154DRAFT_269701 [Amniculicola lignicola CBS 123094]|uniref:Uncharacterized protein n=1 Tax=Amniculicola lignicola CBS 123094 TaxID=1392246 RepID=A0A6A5WAU1_9PLEO|nr:hypothetical protein P154DRAFT_269701 [Amniculicola lignicola CBS 123094]
MATHAHTVALAEALVGRCEERVVGDMCLIRPAANSSSALCNGNWRSRRSSCNRRREGPSGQVYSQRLESCDRCSLAPAQPLLLYDMPCAQRGETTTTPLPGAPSLSLLSYPSALALHRSTRRRRQTAEMCLAHPRTGLCACSAPAYMSSFLPHVSKQDTVASFAPRPTLRAETSMSLQAPRRRPAAPERYPRAASRASNG